MIDLAVLDIRLLMKYAYGFYGVALYPPYFSACYWNGGYGSATLIGIGWLRLQPQSL